MAFVTNGWLKGLPERAREHFPVRGTLSTDHALGEWAKEHNVVYEIKVKKSDQDEDYQMVYLTRGDVTKLVRSIAKGADAELLRDIAAAALLRLGDSELIDLLGSALSKRVPGR